MNFKDWIIANGLKQKFVAEKLGIEKFRLHYICSGKLSPTLSEVMDIAKYTKNSVTSKDWIEQAERNNVKDAKKCKHKF